VAGATDRLTLADWRRQVSELYADVRSLAQVDPEAAWRHWRATREWLYREHPQSPVPPEQRADFRLSTWPYRPALRFEAGVEAAPNDERPPGGAPATGSGVALGALSEALGLPMSAGGEMAFERFGRVRLPLPAGERILAVYWLAGYAGGLFLPFRDATNGAATYGAGRYLLDAAKGADLGGDPDGGSLVLDFNFAYQPSCAFDPRWACPLAPPENRLDIAIEAGERLS
jgi:uncharacterized protein (DUF1684 family)